MMRFVWRALVGVVLVALGVTIAPSPARAQDPTPVVGTADFRNPPRLMNGEYLDTIVTGETVWYAVLYTNGNPYRFEASLPGVDLAANDELVLEVSFVGPTLGSVGSGPGLVQGPGASYLSGHTNVWFVTVTLETTGRLGLEYDVLLDVDGVEETSFDDCTVSAECTFDDELAALDERTATVEADLAAVLEQPTTEIAEREVTSLLGQLDAAETLRPKAEARLTAAEARLTELCAPALTCQTFPDPGSSTPIWAWGIGVVVFGGGAFRAVQKVRSLRAPVA